MRVLIVGCSCIDFYLIDSQELKQRDGLAVVGDTQWHPGCATSNTGSALAKLGASVEISTIIGEDELGNILKRLWKEMNVGIKYVKSTENGKTACAILPVYLDGERGVYFHNGTNDFISIESLFGTDLADFSFVQDFDVIHYGYPPLLRKISDDDLVSFYSRIKQISNNRVLISMDTCFLEDGKEHLRKMENCLRLVDFMHLNFHEAANIFSTELCKEAVRLKENPEDICSWSDINNIIDQFLKRGVGILGLTLGKNGAILATNSESILHSKFINFFNDSSKLLHEFSNQRIYLPCFEVEGKVNAVGAGDSFVAGMIVAMCDESHRNKGPVHVLKVAQAAAVMRISSRWSHKSVDEIIKHSPFQKSGNANLHYVINK